MSRTPGTRFNGLLQLVCLLLLLFSPREGLFRALLEEKADRSSGLGPHGHLLCYPGTGAPA